MRPKALILTLLIVAGFWLVTGHGNWSVRQLIQPLSANGKLWSEPVTAHGSGFGADEQNNIDIYKTNRLATVNITSIVYQRDFFFQVFPQKGIGSGFIINAEGDILTNNHVVSGSRNVTVTLFGDTKQYKATVVGLDRRSDLAILHIKADRRLPFVHLGNSDNLLVGQKVLAIGNPFGLEGTLTTGIVSSLGRTIRGENERTLEGLIQTDAAINPGNSGGPLLDSAGNVVGINTAILGPNGNIGIGFAMPINRAKLMLDDFQAGRKRPKLGVSVVPISGDYADALHLPTQGGLLIQEVDPDSAAAHAGLRGGRQEVQIGNAELLVGGDLIMSIDGKPVDRDDAISRALATKRTGDTLELTIFRNGKTTNIRIRLGDEGAI